MSRRDDVTTRVAMLRHLAAGGSTLSEAAVELHLAYSTTANLASRHKIPFRSRRDRVEAATAPPYKGRGGF